MNFSRQFEQNILNWVKGGIIPSAPVSLQLALHTANPLDDFSSASEVAGGGYARQTVTFGDLIETGDGTKVQNDSVIQFPPTGSATSDWGSITHWSIHSSDDSQFLFYGEFQTPRNIFLGDAYIITSQQINITVQGGFSKQFQQNILNWATQNIIMPTAPSGLLVALHSQNPLNDFSGGGEIRGGGYSRQSIVFGSFTSNNGVGTVIKNTNTPFFGPATENWGALSHISIHSASGSFLFFGALASTENINSGQSYDIKPNNAILTVR
jgi:hypothetical protein